MHVGDTHTVTQTVTPERTAAAIGSGLLEVFGTPFLLAMLEQAATACIQPHLPEGRSSVGIQADIAHISPTPVGMQVWAQATVTAVSEDGRRVEFALRAWDEAGPIGNGTHTRAVITSEGFLRRCREKGKRPAP